MVNIIENKMWDEYWERGEWKKDEEIRKHSIPIRKRESKIMSASQARAKLNKVIEEDDTELEEIMTKIEAAINRKQDYTYISANVKEYTLNKLRELGFGIGNIIKGDRPFDPDTRKINW